MKEIGYLPGDPHAAHVREKSVREHKQYDPADQVQGRGCQPQHGQHLKVPPDAARRGLRHHAHSDGFAARAAKPLLWLQLRSATVTEHHPPPNGLLPCLKIRAHKENVSLHERLHELAHAAELLVAAIEQLARREWRELVE